MVCAATPKKGARSLKLSFFPPGYPEVQLRHQSRRLQTAVGVLSSQLGVGHSAQFGIHQRDQPVESLLLAPVQFSEQ
jgi:hypothetical protein